MNIRHTEPRRSGVVLIAVLLVVSLLSLAAYQFSESMTSEYKAADSAARSVQAKLFAASGVNYAAALLADPEAYSATLNSNPYDNQSAFQSIAVSETSGPRMDGFFSIVSPYTVDETANGGGSQQYRFGVIDEGGKINPNMMMQIDKTGAKLHDMLMKLPNMTEDIADAIVDWIDADDDPRASGAENSYYSALSPGYRCKNGPLDSLEELLLVRGITPELLFGSDRNRNGYTDPDESANGQPSDRGWSQYLTVYSRERNVDSVGADRVYLNDTDITTLNGNLVTALGDEMANFLTAYKLYGPYSPAPTPPSNNQNSQPGGNNNNVTVNVTKTVNSTTPPQLADLDMTKKPQNVKSIFGLINAKVGISKTVTAVTTTQQPGRNGQPGQTQRTTTNTTTTTIYTSPLADPTKAKQLLPLIFDKLTTKKDPEIPARINVNTAPYAVLAALPGIDETDLQSIVQRRPAVGSPDIGDPTFSTIAWLNTELNISPTKLQALENYITARPQVFRVQSVGYFPRGGPAARIEAVIDTNAGQPRIVYWRDISELGKGFNLQGR